MERLAYFNVDFDTHDDPIKDKNTKKKKTSAFFEPLCDASVASQSGRDEVYDCKRLLSRSFSSPILVSYLFRTHPRSFLPTPSPGRVLVFPSVLLRISQIVKKFPDHHFCFSPSGKRYPQRFSIELHQISQASKNFPLTILQPPRLTLCPSTHLHKASNSVKFVDDFNISPASSNQSSAVVHSRSSRESIVQDLQSHLK
ncbi:hypothetical protein L207DRAFT_586489 [Hyaloscypha variabilis F]|uniref:Uncharacterized protein n=1 Tax=Hyaloscypha variabilis (strain UAMH 11265 / GT02V1 / F) TaxID=1149755 RepID=A0A2J6RE59_HYAVF|nr:hypothetical protein L207DRAFT_586489 [Hyaloscypha variabilis F]